MLFVYGSGIDPRHRAAQGGHHDGDRGRLPLLPRLDAPANVRRGDARSSSVRHPIGIGFSLFVVGLAAFNLLLDFDFIEEAAQRGRPKYMEWYGAFGLIVTLVWLYLEMLRLLQKIAANRD